MFEVVFLATAASVPTAERGMPARAIFPNARVAADFARTQVFRRRRGIGASAAAIINC